MASDQTDQDTLVDGDFAEEFLNLLNGNTTAGPTRSTVTTTTAAGDIFHLPPPVTLPSRAPPSALPSFTSTNLPNMNIPNLQHPLGFPSYGYTGAIPKQHNPFRSRGASFRPDRPPPPVDNPFPSKDRHRRFSGPSFKTWREPNKKDSSPPSTPRDPVKSPVAPTFFPPQSGGGKSTTGQFGRAPTVTIDALNDKIESLKDSIEGILSIKDALPLHSDTKNLEERLAVQIEKLTKVEQQQKVMEQNKKTMSRFSLPPDRPGVSRPDIMDFVIKKSNDLYTLLYRISATGCNLRLSHADMKCLLIQSLEGEHLALFKTMEDSSLPLIFAALENRFLSPHNLSAITTKLHAFKREDDESIRAAMERALQLIRETNTCYSLEDRSGRLRTLAHSILLRIVDKSTARFLNHQEERALANGIVLPIQELIELAEDGEVYFGGRSFSPGNVQNVEIDSEINEFTLRPSKLTFDKSKPVIRSTTPTRSTAPSTDQRRQDFRARQRSSSRERRDALLNEKRKLMDNTDSSGNTQQQARPATFPATPKRTTQENKDPMFYHPTYGGQQNWGYNRYPSMDYPLVPYMGSPPEYQNRRNRSFRERRQPSHMVDPNYAPIMTMYGPMRQTMFIPPGTKPPHIFQEYHRGPSWYDATRQQRYSREENFHPRSAYDPGTTRGHDRRDGYGRNGGPDYSNGRRFGPGSYRNDNASSRRRPNFEGPHNPQAEFKPRFMGNGRGASRRPYF